MEIKKNTSLWEELSKYKILIPDYQRDYAQGRIDGGRIDNIRENFISELLNACKQDATQVCHLGLVFGSYNNNTFVAVDGQQRLTTVFLLHWYLLWRTSNLITEKIEVLKNFNWNTRSHSAQFVQLLLSLSYKEGDVVDIIKSNKDYFSVWEKDPSVVGMLVTIGELHKQYSNNVDFNRLFNDCKVQYDILLLESTSDGKTYLKMNSRGRSLTTYENIKSQLQNHIKTFYDNDENNRQYKALVSSFDNEWSNFMLQRTLEQLENSFKDPDIAFMYFINEYSIGRLLIKNKIEYANNLINAKIKPNSNLSDVPFCNFNHYKEFFSSKEDVQDFEKKLNWIINNYDTIKKVDIGKRYDSIFFLESILEDSPRYSDRTLFFCMLKYAELSTYDQLNKESFEHWMRVFYNLVENTDINNTNLKDIVSAINTVNNKDIYQYLNNNNNISAFTKEQVEEEITKAKQIKINNCWENKIIQAEKYAFFKGAIRFLFKNNNEETNWNDFDKKLGTSMKIFNKYGLKPEYRVSIMSRFYSLCTNFNTQLYWDKKVFNGNSITWKKNILLKKEYISNIHHILLEDDFKVETTDQKIKALSSIDLIKYLLDKNENGREMYVRNPHYALYFCGDKQGILLDYIFRDNTISKLLNDNHFTLNDPTIIIQNTTKYWGFDINFSYEDDYQKINLQWYREGYNIYLMDDNWQYLRRNNPREEENDDRKSFFCFCIEESWDTQTIIDKIIEEKNSDNN